MEVFNNYGGGGTWRDFFMYALRVASWNVALHLEFARRIKNTIRSWNAVMILLSDKFGVWLLGYDWCVAERHCRDPGLAYASTATT